MPKDPLPASSPGKLPTNEIDIGHVAPSFASEELWNTLVVRPTYRLSLRVGDIEQLFPDEPTTKPGRMARMQVAGLFYFPLAHSKATQAFDGVPAVAGPPAIPALMGTWDFFKKKVLADVTDAEADAAIKTRLEEWVLEGGGLPPPAAEGVKPTNDNFCKFRLPGGYTFNDGWGGVPFTINRDPAYAMGYTADLYALETRYRTDNPVLGKLPLIALVEQLDPYTLEWKPVKDIWVYFQLLDPYPLPDFDATKSVLEQYNRPPLRESTIGPPAAQTGAGPDRLTKTEEAPTGARAFNAKDPQRGNCRHDRGGVAVQGNLNNNTDVANVVFSTTSTKGFNAAHTPARTNPPAHFINLAEAATVKGESHKHAVRSKTNDAGEAGVIMLPSRCGGDRYRVRAYVGPADVNSPLPFETDGTGARAIRVDTGTIVVWRNARVSRYVRQDVTSCNATLVADMNTAGLNIGGNPVTTTWYLRQAGIDEAKPSGNRFATANFDETPPATFSTKVASGDAFENIRTQWARAFVELETEPGFSVAESLTEAEFQRVRSAVIADMKNFQGTLGLNLDIDRLFYAGTPFSVDTAVTSMPMRHSSDYNSGFPAGDARRINLAAAAGNNSGGLSNLLFNVLAPSYGRHLASNGYATGLTLVSSGFGASGQLWGEMPGNTGLAVPFRTGFVWCGQETYPTTVNPVGGVGGKLTYDYTSNSAHELGHCQFRAHAPGQDPGGSAGGGNNAAVHDAMANNLSVCVMSYQSCEGQFCAKCLFSLRGWDMSKI